MLSVVMLSVVMLSIIMLSIILLSIIMLSVDMLNTFMLSVMDTKIIENVICVVECRYVEWHHAKCRGTLGMVSILGQSSIADAFTLTDVVNP